MYMLPNLIGYSKWLNGWFKLYFICQFSRHYKQCQCQIFMEYTCVYSTPIFENWMDRFECDGLLTRSHMIEKLWRVWPFKCESTSNIQLVVVQTANNCNNFFLFVTYTIIQSITHPNAHTPGAVGSQHCGTWGAVGGSVPCSRVSPQSWTIPARAEIRTHNLGLQVQCSIH